MNHRKHGRGLAGLVLVAALAMMAFASSAQAGTLDFYIGGNPAKSDLHVPINGKQIGTNNFLLVAALNLEIKCGKFTVAEGSLLGPHKLPGKLLFEECKAFEISAPLAEIPTCQIIVTEADTKSHITATGQILPTELLGVVEPLPYAVLAEGDAVVLFLKGKGCPLPLTNLVKGEICLKIDENHKTPLLLLTNDTIQKECKPRTKLEGLNDELPKETPTNFKDKLLYGAQVAVIDAHLEVFATGAAHEKLTLGVLLLP